MRRSAGGSAVAAPRTAPARVADGVTFTYRVASTGRERAARQSAANGAPEATPGDMLATVRMSGPNVRLDMREGTMPMMGQGGYLLIRGADQQIVLVSPKDRKAIVIGTNGMGAGFGALTNNALVKLTIRDARFTFEDLGPGERILGYPTRHARVHTGAAQMQDYHRRYGDGIALRSVSVNERTDSKGTAVDTLRMEVTELSRGGLDPALFAVPAGYETVDMRQLAAAADSARRAGGAQYASTSSTARLNVSTCGRIASSSDGA